MNFTDYKAWFASVFGPNVANKILDEQQECINKDAAALNIFFENYERFEEVTDYYNIKGCKVCISEKIAVRNQDCPGFLGKLNEVEIVIVGLEPNISTDIHIAYEQYESGTLEPLFKRYDRFFQNLKKRAYVTDIAKCMSTKPARSQELCFNTHFLKEIEILLSFNPRLKLILQGTTVESYLKELLTPALEFNNNEIRSRYVSGKKKPNLLFKRQFFEFHNIKVPTVMFPHTSNQNSALWKEINETNVFNEIKLKLNEFHFT